MSPAEREARQMIADKKAMEAADKAYGSSLRVTEEAPAAPKKAASEPVKKAKGGYVRAADGIAQRGKTRGKIC
jgi:hypothetical protein